MSYKVVTVRTFEVTEASTTWTIQHGMGAYPVVDVYIDNNGTQEKIMPSSVTYDDENQCTISFTVPRIGFVVIA